MIEAEWRTLGLEAAEERAYEALLTERATEKEELAQRLELPQDQLQSALDRLVEHGLALPPPSCGALPRPAAPASAIRTLIHRRQAELHLKSAELERLRMSADQLADALLPGSGIEVIAGRREIAERAGVLLASAEHEVVILDHPLSGLDIDALLERGVTVRAVLDRERLPGPERTRVLTALVERGLKARVAPAVPTGLIAVDRRTTLLPPHESAGSTASALVIDDALLRNALVPLFETVWERATPLGGGTPDGPLPAPQRELLSLLAAGLKDEAIARRLGVHVHTARRRISRLLESLGAETRFQAGAQATLRGWLATE
ncbi:helix-turn-helix domain-containing protein [Streptomyces sp. SCSIO 30461]|uniref:helix-turn-helix domain-containing protein n=1 Tax=Streptomyces sp. SCSIO 30461 TaxID=3118085 RepID=UPI0030D254A9